VHAENPSDWVQRFVPLIRPGGKVLDLASGNGRHARLLLAKNPSVVAVDRDIEKLRRLAGPNCEVRTIDLETGDPHDVIDRLGRGFDAIVVTNYLYRPLLRPLAAVLAPAGVLIYETFMIGNERFGRPRNPEFLLRPGELLDAFPGLSVIAFEQGEVVRPLPAMIQRIASLAGPVGRLPEPPYLIPELIPKNDRAPE